jgi:hypothetical protein
MYRTKFLKIVESIRENLGYSFRNEDNSSITEEIIVMEIQYGDFAFSIVHSLINNPEKILIESNFGKNPEAKKEEILLKLLSMNCMLAEVDGSMFSLSDNTDEVIYTLACEIDKYDGISLLHKMTEIVWHGRRWLETRFITSHEETINTENLTTLA